MVQPDVVVLRANQQIIASSPIVGAPDLMVKVTSPGSASHNRHKQDAYVRAGIREYWLADPAAQTVELLRLSAD